MEEGDASVHGVWAIIMYRYFLLLKSFLIISVKRELEYRTNTMLNVVLSFVWVGTTYLVLSVIYSQAGKIAGWSMNDTMLLIMVYYVISTILRTFVTPSIIDFATSIRLGKLDLLLTKPVDTQFMTSCQKLNLIRSLRGFLMFGALVYFVQQYYPVSIPVAALAFLFGILGILGMYALYYIFATASFWFENIWNLEEIFFSMLEAGKQPFDIYQGSLRMVALYIIPVAGIGAIPTLIILNKVSPLTLFMFAATTLGLFLTSRIFLFFALRRYASASS